MKSKNNDLRWKISDILGFEVFNQSGDSVGVLSDIILAGNGNNDVWIVKCYSGEVLILTLKSTVKEVNFARKKIFVVLPKEYEDIYGTVKSADGGFEYKSYFIYED